MKNVSLASVLLFLGLLALVQSCGGGTATGNPLITLRFDTYTASRGFGVPFVTSSYATVSSLTLCFKRLRFKADDDDVTTDPENDDDNADFEIGEITVSSTGTSLGAINVLNGTYERIEFDLEDDCASGKSMQLTNSSGSFSTNSRISIKFDGSLTIAGVATTLDLQLDSIVTALDGAASNGDLKTLSENASGSF
jgi:hypothetical protein